MVGSVTLAVDVRVVVTITVGLVVVGLVVVGLVIVGLVVVGTAGKAGTVDLVVPPLEVVSRPMHALVRFRMFGYCTLLDNVGQTLDIHAPMFPSRQPVSRRLAMRDMQDGEQAESQFRAIGSRRGGISRLLQEEYVISCDSRGAYWNVSPLGTDLEAMDGWVDGDEAVAHLISGGVTEVSDVPAVECLEGTVHFDLISWL